MASKTLEEMSLTELLDALRENERQRRKLGEPDTQANLERD